MSVEGFSSPSSCLGTPILEALLRSRAKNPPLSTKLSTTNLTTKSCLLTTSLPQGHPLVERPSDFRSPSPCPSPRRTGRSSSGGRGSGSSVPRVLSGPLADPWGQRVALSLQGPPLLATRLVSRRSVPRIGQPARGLLCSVRLADDQAVIGTIRTDRKRGAIAPARDRLARTRNPLPR